MTVMPISAAIPIVKAAIYPVLAPLVALDSTGLPSVYWNEAKPERAPTYLVFQSQDKGGKAEPMIGMRGWSGLITVKAYAPTDDAVDQLLPLVETAMMALAQPSGYSVTVTEVNALTIPATDSIFAGGLLFRIAIYPA